MSGPWHNIRALVLNLRHLLAEDGQKVADALVSDLDKLCEPPADLLGDSKPVEPPSGDASEPELAPNDALAAPKPAAPEP